MGKVIKNRWTHVEGLSRAEIMGLDDGPEGLLVERLRAEAGRAWQPDPSHAHILSIFEGRARLRVDGEILSLEPGVHAFLPRGVNATLEGETELAWVHLGARRARGERLLLRDEAFVRAAAVPGHALRWIFTPQYLSRRVFLHHDPALLSQSGLPVSWFHTTMFDVAGLPPNAEGEPVFKMSYDSRTELNVCYEVAGEARVRMAQHPYREGSGQRWEPWQLLDGDSTYCLDETSIEPDSGRFRSRRNKHEVLMLGGHVSLFCLFDPAPTGLERHRPGEYSDYEPFEEVSTRPEYGLHCRELARFDTMVDALSLAKARGCLEAERRGPYWELFEAGREAQRALEAKVIAEQAAEGKGRERILARWCSE